MNTQLAELLQKGYQVEKEFIAALSDEEHNAQGTFEAWSARDTIAHNAYWRKHHAEDVLAVLAGKTPTNTDEQINQEIYVRYKDQSWEDIDRLVDAGMKSMAEAIAAISKEDLQRHDFYPWEQGIPMWREILGNIYMHPIIHLAEWHIKRGNPARAAEMYQEMTRQVAPLDDSPAWLGTVRYNNACSFSILGEKETAINELREAFKLNPALMEWSKQDTDLEPIRGEAGFQALYE
jgi:tetratricopeptide (TPR) repeat protein